MSAAATDVENTLHTVAEMICVRCVHRWIGVYPSVDLLKNLQCPACLAPGGVILTGQNIRDDIEDTPDPFYGK